MPRDLRLIRALASPSVDRSRDFPAYLEEDHAYRAAPDPRTRAVERAYFCAADPLATADPLAADDSRRTIVDLESRVLPVLARIEAEGVAFDLPSLRAVGRDIAERTAILEAEIYDVIGERFNLASVKQLQQILYERLGLPRGKKTKTGYSVDNDVLSELVPSCPVVGLILEHRTLQKLRGTYVEGLERAVSPRSGRIHTTYLQLGAATGRLASEAPNLQNIPAGDPYSDRIKACFVARSPAHGLLVADYSQVELRILACLSGDESLTEAFRSGEDIHARTARFLFGEHAAIDSERRRIAKSVNFGVIYGITGFGLSKVIRTGPREADEYIRTFYRRYPRVREFYDRLLADARINGYVETAFGRRRFLPTINDANRMIRERTEREAINMPIQGTNADIVKEAMVRLDAAFRERSLDARIIMQVHDELVFEVASDVRPEVEALVRDTMEGVYDGPLRLVVDLGAGSDWLAAKH